MAKFCRVLDSIKSRFGILFSKQGISGEDEYRYAGLEQIKVFQDRGMVIVVMGKSDLEQVANGTNFTSLLRTKYENVKIKPSKKTRVTQRRLPWLILKSALPTAKQKK